MRSHTSQKWGNGYSEGTYVCPVTGEKWGNSYREGT